MFLDLPSSERFLRTFFPTSVEVVHLTKRPLTRLCENFITSINSYTAHLRCKSTLKAFIFILSQCASSSNCGQCVCFFFFESTQSLKQFLFSHATLERIPELQLCTAKTNLARVEEQFKKAGKEDFHHVMLLQQTTDVSIFWFLSLVDLCLRHCFFLYLFLCSS